jgi:hypothetical protein
VRVPRFYRVDRRDEENIMWFGPKVNITIIVMLTMWPACNALAQTPPPPQQKWLPFVAQQWSAAQALCQEDINPLAAQIGALQAQLADARKQIEELKKPKDDPK